MGEGAAPLGIFVRDKKLAALAGLIVSPNSMPAWGVGSFTRIGIENDVCPTGTVIVSVTVAATVVNVRMDNRDIMTRIIAIPLDVRLRLVISFSSFRFYIRNV